MKCPLCRSSKTEVYNSRTTKFATQIWRRRRCLNCQATFTTYEVVDLGFLKVKSPNYKRPCPYSRAKLFSSIYAAFLEVQAKDTTIDAVTDTVEAKLLDLQKPLISAEELVDVVLQTLKHFNTTAFVRYLSQQNDIASEAQLRRALKQY